MSTIDHDLARVRADLRAAVQRDIGRRARRRKIARVGIVPILVLMSAGAAVAFVPRLGDPAPDSLTARLERDLARLREQAGPKVADHINAPDGKRLTLAAVGDSTLLYGAVEPSGAWCAVDTTTAGQLQGSVCHEAAKAGRPDEVVFIAMGGGSTRAQNVVSGRVGAPSARTVHIHLPGWSEPIVTPVQRLGFFITQLPDSTLRAGHPIPLTAQALDADGKVVARSSESGGG
jgi:hypothetical protein